MAGARDAGGGSRGIPLITRVGVSRALPGRILCPSPSPDTDIDAAYKYLPGAQGPPTPSPRAQAWAGWAEVGRGRDSTGSSLPEGPRGWERPGAWGAQGTKLWKVSLS